MGNAMWRRPISLVTYKVERENQVAMTCHTKLHETALHQKLVANKLMQAHQDIEVRERLADTC